MKKLFSALSVSMLSMLLFAGLASAHVVVYPKIATQGSYEKFTVRVPSESESPTISVAIEIPADVTVSRFQPMAGWKYEITKDTTDKITNVLEKFFNNSMNGPLSKHILRDCISLCKPFGNPTIIYKKTHNF